MRVAIVGAGALGSVLGGLLAASGTEVVLIRRDPEQIDVVREQGLHLEGVSGDKVLHPPIFGYMDDAGSADIVLVLVKAYDTRSAVPVVERVLGNEGVVLTLQNGVGNYEILNEGLPGKVLLGTTTIGAMVVDKGKFRHTGFGDTHLGEANGEITERAKSVAQVLEKMGGGPVQVEDNAFGCVWSKLVLNAAINAPATLLRVRNGDLPSTDAGRELIHEVVSECLEVAGKKGIQLIFEDPEQKVLDVCAATSGNLNSMFQDILAGRRTEIDNINWAVAREASSVGVASPANVTLARLITSLEGTASQRVPDTG